MAEFATGDKLQRRKAGEAWETVHTITFGDQLFLFRNDRLEAPYRPSDSTWRPVQGNNVDSRIAPTPGSAKWGGTRTAYVVADYPAGFKTDGQVQKMIADEGWTKLQGIGFIVPTADVSELTTNYAAVVRKVEDSHSDADIWGKTKRGPYAYRVLDSDGTTVNWSTEDDTRVAGHSDEVKITGGTVVAGV